MGEICTNLIHLEDGEFYIVKGSNTYVITENHTLSDIVRFLVRQAGGPEDIRSLLKEHEDE